MFILIDYPRSTNTSNRVILTKERLQEVNGLIQRLTERQVVLIKKRRELESTKQPVLWFLWKHYPCNCKAPIYKLTITYIDWKF